MATPTNLSAGDIVSVKVATYPQLNGRYTLELLDGALVAVRTDAHGYEIKIPLTGFRGSAVAVTLKETAAQHGMFLALAAKAQRLDATSSDRAIFADYLEATGSRAAGMARLGCP